MTYQKVTDTVVWTYTEEDLARSLRFVEDARMREFLERRDRKELLGKRFIFEQLECGHLGECLGMAGDPNLKEPATKRRCEH